MQDFIAIWDCSRQQYTVYYKGSYLITLFRYRDVINYTTKVIAA